MFSLRKVFLAFAVVLVCLISGIYVFLSLNAKKVFNEKIGSLTQRHVEVKAIYPVPPTGIVVEGLDISGLLKARKFRLDIDLWQIFRQEIQISDVRLDDPVFFLERNELGELQAPALVSSGQAFSSGVGVQTSSSNVDVSSQKEVHRVAVILKKVAVRNGEVHFREKNGREFVVDKIRADMTNVPLTGDSVRTGFLVTGSLVQLNVPFVGHFMKAKGWLNWADRSMEAVAQAVDDDGRIGLDVAIKSVNNDMAVDGKVRMVGGQSPQASGQKTGVVENVVLGVLDSTRTDIDMKFSFRTQMDRFQIGKIQLRGNITTGLNSSGSSANIVESLKALGDGFLKEEKPAVLGK